MIESGPTSLKTGQPVYKPAARLQTGRVRNQFATYTLSREIALVSVQNLKLKNMYLELPVSARSVLGLE